MNVCTQWSFFTSKTTRLGPRKTLNPGPPGGKVFPFLRLVLDIIHRLEAARPGEPEHLGGRYVESVSLMKMVG